MLPLGTLAPDFQLRDAGSGKTFSPKDFKDAAEKSLRLFSERLQRLPQAVPYMLMALDFSLEEPRRVVMAGDAASPAAKAQIGRASCRERVSVVV